MMVRPPRPEEGPGRGRRGGLHGGSILGAGTEHPVTIFWQFAILGVGVGALYALVAQGLVLIYRSSGVVNFAHGATAGVGGYTYYELQFHFSLAWPVCLVAGVAAATAVGTAMQGLVIRRLRLASPLTRVIATTALLAVIVQAANLIFGSAPDFVQGFLSTSTLQVGGVSIEVDRLILTGIALGLTLALWAFYRFTRFGLATTAVAENETVAGVLGVSSDRVALINWAVGSALAGLAGVLLAPIISLTPSGIGLLVVPALAAAMIGNFSSFPLSFAGGLGVGILQSELTHYVTAPGWADASPFLVIVVLMVVRGRALPLRGHVLERLPRWAGRSCAPLARWSAWWWARRSSWPRPAAGRRCSRPRQSFPSSACR